jgi:hypothetical protein
MPTGTWKVTSRNGRCRSTPAASVRLAAAGLPLARLDGKLKTAACAAGVLLFSPPCRRLTVPFQSAMPNAEERNDNTMR